MIREYVGLASVSVLGLSINLRRNWRNAVAQYFPPSSVKHWAGKEGVRQAWKPI